MRVEALGIQSVSYDSKFVSWVGVGVGGEKAQQCLSWELILVLSFCVNSLRPEGFASQEANFGFRMETFASLCSGGFCFQGSGKGRFPGKGT